MNEQVDSTLDPSDTQIKRKVRLVLSKPSDFEWVLCKGCGKKLFRVLRKSGTPASVVEIKCKTCKTVAQYS